MDNNIAERDDSNLIESQQIPHGSHDPNENNRPSDIDGDVVPKISRTRPEPRDRYRRVQMAFLLIGISTLMPWNIFITATDYWMYKFRDINETHIDTPHPNKTELQTFFASYLSISSNVPFLLMLIVNSFVGQKISEDLRTLIGLFSITFIFVITTTFIEVNTDHFQYAFFRSTLGMVVVMSCFSAIFQGSIVSTASVFPSQCMSAYVTGQSVAGIFAVLAQILSLAGQFGPTTTALYYFVSADLVLILTLVVFLALQKSEYFTFYARRTINVDHLGIQGEGDGVSTRDTFLAVSRSRATLCRIFDHRLQIKYHTFTVLNVMAMTIAVFPPLAVLVVPEHPDSTPLNGRFFIPVSSFLIFSLSDFVGRWITSSVPLPVHRPSLMFWLSMSRWLLVPLLMLCNAHPRNFLPVLFENEMWFVLLILLIGLSNGYFFTNAMVNGPKYVSTHLRQKTGFVLVLFMGFGVAIGSVLSNFILRLL